VFASGHYLLRNGRTIDTAGLLGRQLVLNQSLRARDEHDNIVVIDCLIGAGEGIRTLDPDLGKVVLYP
jgi:hypothetical protein